MLFEKMHCLRILYTASFCDKSGRERGMEPPLNSKIVPAVGIAVNSQKTERGNMNHFENLNLSEEILSAIKDMKHRFDIPDTIPEIKQEDIPRLARYADKEANPLYPVPVLMNASELELFYESLMQIN